jgi:DnaJ-class molecular chaperone
MKSAPSFKVVNPNTGEIEKAVMMTCPRCAGHGSTMTDATEGRDCILCKGDGSVIRNEQSGATRRRGAPIDKSELW